MGQEISLTLFNADHFNFFLQKLTDETRLLKELIEQNKFSALAPKAGFEIEAWLVNEKMQAAPNNTTFLQNLDDPLAFPELAKFNIELNGIPQKLTGTVLQTLHNNLSQTWKKSVYPCQAT